MSKEISFVIPSYNEAENIKKLYLRIKNTINNLSILNYEIIYVENGSTDNSLEILKELNKIDSNVKIISFTRNFGLQNAIYAGLNKVEKNYICVLDGDLQDPPELVETFFKKMEKGYDIVFGIRKKREASWIKKILYRLFYFIFTNISEIKMPNQVGEFCLMKKIVFNQILEFKEKNLFIRGLRSWTGYNQIGIEYNRPERNAGEAKFNFFGSISLALDGLVSFSIVPLRLILFIGLISSFLSFLLAIFFFLVKILSIFSFLDADGLLIMPKGMTATTVILLVLTSFLTLSLGIIGEYIAKIYYEIKNRPHYIIKELIE